MKVHVIIVNHRTAHLTVRAAKSVLNTKLETCVCIVDNSEVHEEIEILKAFVQQNETITLVSSVNNGFSAAINIGIQSLEMHLDDFLLVLNSDAQLLPDTLTKLISGYTIKALGMAGAVVLNDDMSIQSHSGILLPFFAYLRMNKTRTNLGILYPVGVTLLFSYKNIKKIGFFDESYFLYFEELDIVMRMKQVGLDCDVIDNAFVLHDQGASTLSVTKGEFNSKIELVKLQSKVQFYKKFFRKWLPMLYLQMLLKGYLPIVSNAKMIVNRRALKKFWID